MAPGEIDCNNCTRLCWEHDYDPKQPYSYFCMGYRTGVIKGKEQAIENEQTDVFVVCTLIGSHSEDCGQHRYIFNVEDFYLELRTLFQGMYATGLFRRTVRSLFSQIREELIQDLQSEIDHYYNRKKYPKPVVIGTKFIEFSCSCGQIFFREWNHDQVGNKYYKPTSTDEKLFDVHRQLGHTVFYEKHRRVKKSKGDNPFWQNYGKYPYL